MFPAWCVLIFRLVLLRFYTTLIYAKGTHQQTGSSLFRELPVTLIGQAADSIVESTMVYRSSINLLFLSRLIADDIPFPSR